MPSNLAIERTKPSSRKRSAPNAFVQNMNFVTVGFAAHRYCYTDDFLSFDEPQYGKRRTWMLELRSPSLVQQ